MEVTVIKEGRHGVLGMGAEEAMVRVSPLVTVPGKGSDISDIDEAAKVVVETLLAQMGMVASVTPQTKPLVGGEGTPGVITLNVKGDDLGILIGRRGQTLASLQHIVRLIVAHQTKAQVPVVIDVEGYKERRYEALQALALRMAEQVKAKRRPFALEPMPAYERRIIHLALADDPDVATESVGEGETRKVVISPQSRR